MMKARRDGFSCTVRGAGLPGSMHGSSRVVEKVDVTANAGRQIIIFKFLTN